MIYLLGFGLDFDDEAKILTCAVTLCSGYIYVSDLQINYMYTITMSSMLSEPFSFVHCSATHTRRLLARTRASYDMCVYNCML